MSFLVNVTGGNSVGAQNLAEILGEAGQFQDSLRSSKLAAKIAGGVGRSLLQDITRDFNAQVSHQITMPKFPQVSDLLKSASFNVSDIGEFGAPSPRLDLSSRVSSSFIETSTGILDKIKETSVSTLGLVAGIFLVALYALSRR